MFEQEYYFIESFNKEQNYNSLIELFNLYYRLYVDERRKYGVGNKADNLEEKTDYYYDLCCRYSSLLDPLAMARVYKQYKEY